MTDEDIEVATVQSLQVLASKGIQIICNGENITDKLKGDVE